MADPGPNPAKVYVAVKASFGEDGTLLPFEIRWEDGRRFRIDHVIDVRQAASLKTGGIGDRYTIVVCGRPSFLFFERSLNRSGNNIGRWFVERRVNC